MLVVYSPASCIIKFYKKHDIHERGIIALRRVLISLQGCWGGGRTGQTDAWRPSSASPENFEKKILRVSIPPLLYYGKALGS